MKKRFVLLAALLVLCLLLTACGGTKGKYLEYTVKTPEGYAGLPDDLISGTISVIRLRLEDAGVKGAQVEQVGEDIIRIMIPSSFLEQGSIEEIQALVGAQGLLEFKDPGGNTFMTGEMIKTALYYYDQGDHQIAFQLTPEGTEIFAEMTRKYVGRTIAIWLDGEELIAPTVQSAITNGSGVINGLGDAERATRIANLIQSGALPMELTFERLDDWK